MDTNCKPSPCGVICHTCFHLEDGCEGCFEGGGEEHCHIGNCTKAKNIAGCWECKYFPCTHIHSIEPEWRDLTIGLIESIKELGIITYSALAIQNVGRYKGYAKFRFKTPEQVKAIIRGE